MLLIMLAIFGPQYLDRCNIYLKHRAIEFRREMNIIVIIIMLMDCLAFEATFLGFFDDGLKVLFARSLFMIVKKIL